jgi:Uma2 family endonuclease
MQRLDSMPATKSHKCTYEEYCLLPDDGKRYEVLDGRVVVSPAAGMEHQGIQAALSYHLYAAIVQRRRGHVFTDVDCHLLAHDIVRPDLVVVLPAHTHRMIETHIVGTPDLAIAILSPSTAARDRTTKKHRYEVAGTPELWIVDGRKRTVAQFVRDGKRFGPAIVHTTKIRHAILPKVEIPLHEVWRGATSSPRKLRKLD